MGPGRVSTTSASASVSGCQRDAGEGDGGSYSAVTLADIEYAGIDVIPEWNPSVFIVVDDIVEKLNVACMKLGVGPPEFFLLTVVRLGEKDYFAYGVHLCSRPEGVNFLFNGRYSTDQWFARQDAAFITLERLLEECGKKLWDFNYMVAAHFRDQAEQLRRLRAVPLADRMSQLEEELAHLKEELARYTNSPHNS